MKIRTKKFPIQKIISLDYLHKKTLPMTVFHCSNCGNTYSIFNTSREGFIEFRTMVAVVDIWFCPMCG